MNDLFGKMLDMLKNKATGSKGSSGSTTSPMPSLPANLDLGKILGSVIGKDGGGMSSLVRKMVAAGLGSMIKSWITRGPNHLISADQVQSAIGSDELNRLAAENGLSPDQLAQLLAEHLPDAVDHMTPDGELRNETGGIIDLTPLSERK